MMSTEENIQVLARAVLSEARTEAQQILSDAESKAEAIRKQAQEQAETERREVLERAKREAEHVRSQCLAAAQLQARRLRLERREKLLDAVFEAVRQRMPTVRQWTDYDQVVRGCLHEAVTHLGAEAARIRADEDARAILADGMLAELSQQLKVHLDLGQPLERGTGLIAETMDGHRTYDNTLEARLDRSQEALRAPVYRLLMGESL